MACERAWLEDQERAAAVRSLVLRDDDNSAPVCGVAEPGLCLVWPISRSTNTVGPNNQQAPKTPCIWRYSGCQENQAGPGAFGTSPALMSSVSIHLVAGCMSVGWFEIQLLFYFVFAFRSSPFSALLFLSQPMAVTCGTAAFQLDRYVCGLSVVLALCI